MIDIERLDRNLQRVFSNPMPSDLRETIGREIEPHTMNSYLDHDEVMAAVEIAYTYIVERGVAND